MKEAREIALDMMRRSEETRAREREAEARRFEAENRCPHCGKLPWDS